MKRFVLLALLTGCLDSIVDNPCEDGFALDGDECVAEDPDPTVAPPVAELPESPTPPIDPTEPVPPLPLPPGDPDVTAPPPETAEDPVVPCHD